MTDNKRKYDELIDTGAIYNYVKKSLKFNLSKQMKPMKVISMHGKSAVHTKQTIKFLGKYINFFELE